VRILDSLRHGEDLVRMGLSEKTNFEVTLFRAVQSGRSRSIDQVIRKISGMIPEEVKKKPKLDRGKTSSDEKAEFPEIVGVIAEKDKITEYKTLPPVSTDLEVKESGTFISPANAVAEEGKEEPIEVEVETQVNAENLEEISEEPRQIVDREKIELKINELPDGIRTILKEKFQADFVSIEKIDQSKLI
jgi:hypothetical protein